MPTFQLKERSAIAHKPEPVRTIVLVVKVLATDILDKLFVVDDATRVHCRDLAIDCPTLVPGPAPTGPDGPLQKLMNINVVLVQHIRLDRE